MNTTHAERCQLINDKQGQAEAVRLHTQEGLAVSEISTLTGARKPTIIRWLRRSGVYKGRLIQGCGDPSRKSRLSEVVVLWRDDGSNLRNNARCVIHHLRRAWDNDWKGVGFWDDNFHWRNHKARLLYKSSKYTKAKRRLNPSFGRAADLALCRKQVEAWKGEWCWVSRWDEQNHWWNHIERRRYKARTFLKMAYHTRPHFKVALSFRRRVREAIIAQRAGKFRSSSEMLGCTWQFLVTHLESKFKPGMTWENYGPYWHIDHIRPCAAYDLTKESEQRKCFHWTNLQPLTAVENFRKRDRLELVRAHDMSSRLSSSS